MRVYLALGLLAAVSVAQPLQDLDAVAQDAGASEESDPPMPYSFEYSASDAEGSHSHSSTSDGKTVTGQYSIMLADGRMRTVKYVADENGYRAEVITNELGTESRNPADVIMQSSAPTGAEAALQALDAPAAGRAEAPPVITAVTLTSEPVTQTGEPAVSTLPSTVATEKEADAAGEASHLNNVFFPPKYTNYREYRAAHF